MNQLYDLLQIPVEERIFMSMAMMVTFMFVLTFLALLISPFFAAIMAIVSILEIAQTCVDISGFYYEGS